MKPHILHMTREKLDRIWIWLIHYDGVHFSFLSPVMQVNLHRYYCRQVPTKCIGVGAFQLKTFAERILL